MGRYELLLGRLSGCISESKDNAQSSEASFEDKGIVVSEGESPEVFLQRIFTESYLTAVQLNV